MALPGERGGSLPLGAEGEDVHCRTGDQDPGSALALPPTCCGSARTALPHSEPQFPPPSKGQELIITSKGPSRAEVCGFITQVSWCISLFPD